MRLKVIYTTMLIYTLLAVVALSTTGCGAAENMSRSCKGSDLEMGCNALFGYVDRDESANQQTQIDSLAVQVENLQHTIQLNISSLNNLTQLQFQQNVDHSALIAGLQASVTAQQAQLTMLLSRESLTDYLDCGGDGPGFDEVVFRTSSGKLIAYFEQSGNRFLTLLGPGSYQTTDSSSCPFTINGAGKFCDVSGCR